MDQDVINQYENMFKIHSSNKPPSIYGDNTKYIEDSHCVTSERVSKVYDHVSSQIRSLQTADKVTAKRKDLQRLNKYRNVTLTLDYLQDIENPKPVNNFETQYFSDTELINIVDGAEVIGTHQGVMTQEFNTTFASLSQPNSESSKEENIDVKEDVLKINSSCKHKSDVKKVQEYLNDKLDGISEEYGVDFDDEDGKEKKSVHEQSDKPKSPVLKTIYNTSDTPSPLVFDLELFEQFERIAVPFIDEAVDLKCVKQLINSQIIGHELNLQTNNEENCENLYIPVSPILKVDANHLKSFKSDVKVNEIPSEYMKDDILFSSDEEDEYIHKNIQDLPFTCALETSFYNQSDILDKTMYVGFQTASNKSIQICTDSFSKARTILSGLEADNVNVPTVTELVEKCDIQTLAVSKDFITDVSKNVLESYTKELINDTSQDELSVRDTEEKDKEITERINELQMKDIQNLASFKTASNRAINISEKSCQRIFQGIDLNISCEAKNSSKEEELEHYFENPDDVFIQEFCNNDYFNIDLKENDSIQQIETAVNKYIKNEELVCKDINNLSNLNSCQNLESLQNLDTHKIESNLSKFVDFKTASNKNINISEDSIKKTKHIFQDIESDNVGVAELKKNISCSDNNKYSLQDPFKKPETIKDFNDRLCNGNKLDNQFQGFKTANNKPILISKQAMEKTHKIFQDITDDNYSTNLHFQAIKVDKPNINQFDGFKTASNKCIDISDAALAKTNKNFKDIDENLQLINESKALLENVEHVLHTDSPCAPIANTDGSTVTFEGFQTDSNKPVTISETAIEKSKRIFEDIDSQNVIKNEVPIQLPTIENAFQGFRTASNKVIKTSEEAMRKSRKVFEDIDVKDLLGYSDKCDYNKVSISLQTASNVNVGVSNNEISMSNELLDDIPPDKDIGQIIASTNTFKGFKTASNKNIGVSNEAILKSRKLFDDINAVSDNINNKPTTSFEGFQTASNKSVKISNEAILKSKKLFEDINAISDDIDNKPTSFKGFQTASNKCIKISNDAILKSKKLFEDITTNNVTFNNDFKRGTPLKGFLTASNKTGEVSDEVIIKSKKLLEGPTNKEIFSNDVKPTTTLKGFQTASNKTIKVSNEAILKGKVLFEDIDKDMCNIDIKPTTTFKGFHTASNKTVEVSKEAILKSKKLFDDIIPDKEILDKEPNYLPFKGFQTASIKTVEVSKEAILKSKKLFEDITTDKDVIKLTTAFKGFQTASNKTVKVSNEAILKSKKLYENIIIPDEEMLDKEDNVPPFKGFQTASNKTVEVSNEAILKIRKLFEDISTDKKINNVIHSSTTFKGFQTASNKTVEVSDEAISKSKKLLESISDISTEEIGKADILPISSFKGFQIGSKKTVNVSDTSSVKSKKIFKDIHLVKDNNKTMNEYDKISYAVTKSPDLNVLDTQLANNFEETIFTEDFSSDTTPKRSKRSGSPILTCSKAKKTKFSIPYKKNIKIETVPIITEAIISKTNNIFDDNYKKNKKFSLRALGRSNDVKRAKSVEAFKIEDMLEFKFEENRNDITNTAWSIKDLKEYFLNLVNQKLIPDGWLDNHLKFILWKLLSYEITFKDLDKVCTARNVLQQLKYRYDKELYNAERPALRKILEKDDISTKTLVLCVAGVYVDGVNVPSITNPTNNIELLLTDGWYCIKACVDKMITDLVLKGKIVVGTKIVTNGAELMNCEQGVAPWEETSSIRLKLFGNSIKRARWDARLGYHGNAAILSHLSSVRPDGGKVSKLRLFVARVYPSLYVEKFQDGSTVTRSERLESQYQMKYEAERHALIEKICEEVEKEISDQESQDSERSSGLKRRQLDSGSQIAKLMKRSTDPNEFRYNLTSTQNQMLEEYTARQREEIVQKMQARVVERVGECNAIRNVVPLLKIRVAGVNEGVITKAMMSIWKPNDAILEIVTEGAWIDAANIVPTAVRNSEIQISAGRQSLFSRTKSKNEELVHLTDPLKRKCYHIKDLKSTITTEYNEIDTVGLIFLIDPPAKEFGQKFNFQNVYLTDADKNFVCINFWGGIRKFGFDNLLDTGQIVSCINLQKRAGNTGKSIPQYRCTDLSYFTKTPKSNVARNMISDLEGKISKIDKSKFCEDCVSLRNNFAVVKNVTPYRPFNDFNVSKNRIFIDSPLTSKKVDDFNLTGLDFDSTFRHDTEISPKLLARKKLIKEKLSKLKMYGEPPPLSPIHMLNKTKNAAGAYKSPFSSANVAIEKENLQVVSPKTSLENDQNSSPVLPVNRTCKRTVNPVKLNFSNSVAMSENDSELVDHFAEEFDGSPPLSLD